MENSEVVRIDFDNPIVSESFSDREITNGKEQEANSNSTNPPNTSNWDAEGSESADNRHVNHYDEETAANVEVQNVVECTWPKVNCPEKIVICLDLDEELDSFTFRSRSGDKLCPLKLLKRALSIFLHTKSQMNKNHEFALVLLHDTATWVQNFTKNTQTIMDYFDELKPLTERFTRFDLSSLFDDILDKVTLPHMEESSALPPPYIVRVLLIYGRSRCKPFLKTTEALNILQSSPLFFLDAFYIHEPPKEDNDCEEIFDILCELDDKGLSYVFEVARNPTKLFDRMAQLLAHPLQRPIQRDSHYKLEPKEFSQQLS